MLGWLYNHLVRIFKRSEKRVIHLRPQDSVALKFANPQAFRQALDILWDIRKTNSIDIPFALPPAENTFIIPKQYLSYFQDLSPVQQEVGSTADLSNEEVNKLRGKYFFPKSQPDRHS